MPKITKCLKCLKLRYSVYFIKLERKNRLYYSEVCFSIHQTSTVHKKDGAPRGASACAEQATP